MKRSGGEYARRRGRSRSPLRPDEAVVASWGQWLLRRHDAVVMNV